MSAPAIVGLRVEQPVRVGPGHVMHELNDLVTPVEIAARFHSTSQVVSNWTIRYRSYPKPLLSLGRVNLYSWEAVQEWFFQQWGRQKLEDALAG